MYVYGVNSLNVLSALSFINKLVSEAKTITRYGAMIMYNLKTIYILQFKIDFHAIIKCNILKDKERKYVNFKLQTLYIL